jgi:hypothetical protein
LQIGRSILLRIKGYVYFHAACLRLTALRFANACHHQKEKVLPAEQTAARRAFFL